MDHFYSDLEEGEILDSPPSPDLNINRKKKLPQRYIVKGNKTPLHKHKRNCKHSSRVRHHAKKLSKLNKTPVRKKDSSKWYHKHSYTEKCKVFSKYDSSNTLKRALPKNVGFSQNSLFSEMKGSLKNISPLKKVHANFSKHRSQKIPFLKQNFKTSKNDFATSDPISSAKMQKKVNNSVTNNMSSNTEYVAERTDSNEFLIEDLSKNSDDTSSVIELSISDSKPEPPLIDLSRSPDNTSSTVELNCDNDVKNIDNPISNTSVPVKEEESEDEEELRRIALATCAKRKALTESTNTIQNVDYTCSAPLSDLICVNDVQIPHQKIINHLTTDNYEVVDMEVDEEMQDTLENQQISLINQQSKSAENLFVIDKNPSEDFLKKNNLLSEMQAANNSDDDFEVDLLRAQLLTNMNRKKFLQEHSNKESNVVHKKQMPITPQKVNNYQKLNLLFSHKRLKSAKHFLRKRSVNKLINININNKNNTAPPPPVRTSEPSKRLIITVNGESSDDSDNSDEETNTVSENPVDSIVALISDCRQKSEFNVLKKEEIVPKAVSCLSKAQQEEYNSLMKILAKKKKLSPGLETVTAKNSSVHSPLEDLKKLERKLIALRNAVKNKKDSMALLSEEVNSKRHQYMKSKLTAQHLKEQWVAAEKVRKAKLLDWSKTCDNFKVMKKSMSDLENKMNEVQNLCSKLGSSLQGQTYKLPLLTSINEQS